MKPEFQVLHRRAQDAVTEMTCGMGTTETVSRACKVLYGLLTPQIVLDLTTALQMAEHELLQRETQTNGEVRPSLPKPIPRVQFGDPPAGRHWCNRCLQWVHIAGHRCSVRRIQR